MHRFSNVHKTNTEIESLLRSNNIPKKYRWYPFLVSELEADLSHGIFDRLNLTKYFRKINEHIRLFWRS